jgi:hypothetical protein
MTGVAASETFAGNLVMSHSYGGFNRSTQHFLVKRIRWNASRCLSLDQTPGHIELEGWRTVSGVTVSTKTAALFAFYAADQ